MRVYIGCDSREREVDEVCEKSIRRFNNAVDIRKLVLDELPVYTRPYHKEHGQYIDDVTGANFSTEFAFSRFLVPYLNDYDGWAVFCDCDFLFRADVMEMSKYMDKRFAVAVVPHDHQPEDLEKMDGQVQSRYFRKNWSSFILWNCGHEKNRRLTPDKVNEMPGLWLHGFQWLDDGEINQLPEEWNWLVGEHGDISPTTHFRDSIDIKAVHMTEGTPLWEKYRNVPFADEWLMYR